MFLESFSRLLEIHCPPALVRAAEADAGAAAPLEAELARSGFLDILRPEAEGGAGLALSGFASLAIACGAHLCPVPYPELAVARGLGVAPDELPLEARAALVAARMAGAVERLLEFTIEHATTRQQFGRPLAAFQAVQQQLAQLAEEVAAARLAACIGLAGPGFTPARSAAAKIRCNEAAGLAAAIAHQLHGAIGATVEHDLQLFTRALWRWQTEAGTTACWAERLGRDRLAKGGASVPYIQIHLEAGDSA